MENELKNPTVVELVRRYLERTGHEGLVDLGSDPDDTCCCPLERLFWCGAEEWSKNCQPVLSVQDPGGLGDIKFSLQDDAGRKAAQILVEDIVKSELQRLGYDGLLEEEEGCACERGDMFLCEESWGYCRAAYRDDTGVYWLDKPEGRKHEKAVQRD